MKKIFCLVLCIMLFTGLSCFAEDVDLSGYSVEELNLLIERIQKEIHSRNPVEYWFDYGIGQFIPKIKLESGREPVLNSFLINENDRMTVAFKDTTDTDYENYILDLKLSGFTEELKRTAIETQLKNEDGIIVEIFNYNSGGFIIKARKK